MQKEKEWPSADSRTHITGVKSSFCGSLRRENKLGVGATEPGKGILYPGWSQICQDRLQLQIYM